MPGICYGPFAFQPVTHPGAYLLPFRLRRTCQYRRYVHTCNDPRHPGRTRYLPPPARSDKYVTSCIFPGVWCTHMRIITPPCSILYGNFLARIPHSIHGAWYDPPRRVLRPRGVRDEYGDTPPAFLPLTASPSVAGCNKYSIPSSVSFPLGARTRTRIPHTLPPRPALPGERCGRRPQERRVRVTPRTPRTP